MNKKIESLVAGWNKLYGPEYQIREQEVRWNLSLKGPYLYSMEEVAGIMTLLVRTADALWISLWDEIPAGTENAFAESLKEFARREKKISVALGGDEFHFVPGVPLGGESGRRLARFLETAGFAGRTVVDLVGSLNGPAVMQFIADAIKAAEQKDWRFTEVQNREALADFLRSEFPGRWCREYEFWRSQESTPSASYFVLQAAAENQILGFVRLSSYGTSPGAWLPGNVRLPPHQQGLGPIGVAKSLRGQGAGRALLGLALSAARERQASCGANLCIDWTDVPAFYKPLGFEEVRTYQLARFKLS